MLDVNGAPVRLRKARLAWAKNEKGCRLGQPFFQLSDYFFFAAFLAVFFPAFLAVFFAAFFAVFFAAFLADFFAVFAIAFFI